MMEASLHLKWVKRKILIPRTPFPSVNEMRNILTEPLRRSGFLPKTCNSGRRWRRSSNLWTCSIPVPANTLERPPGHYEASSPWMDLHRTRFPLKAVKTSTVETQGHRCFFHKALKNISHRIQGLGCVMKRDPYSDICNISLRLSSHPPLITTWCI